MDSPAARIEPDTDFPIAWEPGDEELEWEWDDMHMPRAIPPLSEDYVAALMRGVLYRYRTIGLPATVLTRVWNGYTYFAFRIDRPPEEHEAVMKQAPELRRQAIPRAAAYWRKAVPELRAMYGEMDAISGEEPTAQLAAAWDRAWASVERAWEIHFYSITGPYQVLNDLADRYEQVVQGGTAAEGLEMVAGAIPELRAVELALEQLTAVAAAAPAVASRLQAGPPPDIDQLRGLPGGDAFTEALTAFLASHGHLGHVSEDLMAPSWAEDAGPLLIDIGRRLERPTESVARRWAARSAAAESRAALVRAQLADRPDELVSFEELLATAREIGPLTEGHNYWIDRMAGDRLRRLTRRVGRRLVRDGVFDDREDIAFLRRAEVAQVIVDATDRRSIIAERRRRHAAQSLVRPPRKVGRVSEPAEGGQGGEVDRFDGARFDPLDELTLKGTGASAGLARGPARVVSGPQDFERVRPGDIVVAPASNPGWVPLFAIAGGFVTDTGGVLSHAAVVAREFGLPAVVGTGNATARIVDGSMVSIDGKTGLVRLG